MGCRGQQQHRQSLVPTSILLFTVRWTAAGSVHPQQSMMSSTHRLGGRPLVLSPSTMPTSTAFTSLSPNQILNLPLLFRGYLPRQKRNPTPFPSLERFVQQISALAQQIEDPSPWIIGILVTRKSHLWKKSELPIIIHIVTLTLIAANFFLGYEHVTFCTGILSWFNRSWTCSGDTSRIMNETCALRYAHGGHPLT